SIYSTPITTLLRIITTHRYHTVKKCFSCKFLHLMESLLSSCFTMFNPEFPSNQIFSGLQTVQPSLKYGMIHNIIKDYLACDLHDEVVFVNCFKFTIFKIELLVRPRRRQ